MILTHISLHMFDVILLMHPIDVTQLMSSDAWAYTVLLALLIDLKSLVKVSCKTTM